MNTQSIIENIINFTKFLSTTYGTGNVTFDILVASGAALFLLILLTLLKSAALGSAESNEDFAQIQSHIDDLQIQLSELKFAVTAELEKWRGELGFLKQEMNFIGKSSPISQVEVQVVPQEKNDMASLFRK